MKFSQQKTRKSTAKRKLLLDQISLVFIFAAYFTGLQLKGILGRWEDLKYPEVKWQIIQGSVGTLTK